MNPDYNTGIFPDDTLWNYREKYGSTSLDLPAHGDINDSKVEYSHLIGQAISSLFAKVLTTPFSLLVSLAEGHNLKFVQFITI